MEEAFEAVKKFIEEGLPARLEALASDDVPLPPPAKVAFGVVDLSRVEAKASCAIVPDRTAEDEPTLTRGTLSHTLTVGFICRGARYDVLLRQMVRYAEAFRVAVRSDWTLGGLVEKAELGGTEFFPDAGATNGTCTMAEVELTVQTSEAQAAGLDPFE